MSEVSQSPLSDRTHQVERCVSIVLASDDMQASAVEAVDLRITAAVNVHASDECVNVEHNANWYVLCFNARDSRWSAQMFDNERNVVCAIAMR